MKTPNSKSAAHTPTPWVIDDRHIHPAKGLTYPRGIEPETDVIVEVNTSCHERGLINETDKANMALIVRAVNSHAELVAAAEAAEKSLQWVLSVMQDIPSGSNLVETYHELQGAIANAKGTS